MAEPTSRSPRGEHETFDGALREPLAPEDLEVCYGPTAARVYREMFPGPIGVDAIASRTGLHRETVDAALEALRGAGLVEPYGWWPAPGARPLP